MHIEVNTIDIKHYNIGILKGHPHTNNMIQILLVIFIIPRKICNMDMQYSIWILFYMCVLFFRNSHKWSYFRIQQKNISFIHIRILILQIFSLFSICEFFNMIIGASCHTFCFKLFEFFAINISEGCDMPKFWVNPWLQLNKNISLL